MTHAKPDDDDSDLGPAMRQLTEKQRKFVQIYVEQPMRNGASTAAAAGYSTGGKSGVGVRFEAYRLLRTERCWPPFAKSSTSAFAAML